MTQAKTRVYVTVDVEGAEERWVRGQLQPPMDYDLRVWGRLTNQRRELGIGLLMDELEAHGFRGTFFVEPLSSCVFGRRGLRDICTGLLARGHDVQLHLHPSHSNPLWLSTSTEAPDDDMAAYSFDDQRRLLELGLELLVEAGVPRGSIHAFRAGNFGANADTWAAMRDAGLSVSSNYNPCYFAQNCAMRSSAGGPDLFRPIEGLWEAPIATFVQPNGAHRHLQIAAVALEEMKEHLWQCRRRDIRHVVLVTHSFELMHVDSVRARRGRLNRVNAARLRGLLAFLRANPDDFEVETLGQLAERGAAMQAAPQRASYPQATVHGLARRAVEQALKRLDARMGLPLAASFQR